MKYLYSILAGLIFICNVASAQSINNVVVTPTPATCSSVVQVTTFGDLWCANATFTNTGFTIVGMTVTVTLDIFQPMICLPAIVPYTDVQTLGILPGGTYNVTVNTYENGVFNSTFSTMFNVGGGSGTFITPPVKICPGDSALIHGQWQSVQAVYSDTFSNGPCDSISVTFLQLITHPITTIDVNLCAGDSIFAGGTWQTSSGNYFDTLTSSIGCDSVVNSKVTVVTPGTSTASIQICQGDSAFVGGAWQNSSGVYTDVYPDGNGCDSIVTTTLTVSSIITTSVNAQICSGDSLFAGGAWQTTTGNYTDTYTSSSNCDSVVTTNLSVVAVLTSNSNDTICDGDSVFVGGNWQTSDGTYSDTLASSSNCDSIHTAVLTFINCNTGIFESGYIEYRIYPNPAQGYLTLTFESQNPEAVTLYDIFGRTVMQIGDKYSVIEVVDLPRGVYLIELDFGGLVSYEKLVLK